MLVKIVKAKSNPINLYMTFPETNNSQRIYLIDERGYQTWCTLEYYLEHFEPITRKVFVVQMD